MHKYLNKNIIRTEQKYMGLKMGEVGGPDAKNQNHEMIEGFLIFVY